jgi:hypothetical protein
MRGTSIAKYAPGQRAAALAFAALVVAGAAGGWLATSQSDASTPSPAALILKASQVGPGYRSTTIPDGSQVTGQVTLDLCYYTFASENLRTARLQAAYIKTTAFPEISNEVVAYKAGGTAEAMAELLHAAKACPSTPRTGPTAGEQQPVTFHLTRLTEPHLLSQYLALRVVGTGTVNGKQKTATEFVIYQINGSVLSGIYAFGTNSAATLALAVHAAQQSARNLG